MKSFIAFAFAFAVLGLGSTGCRPLCKVTIPNRDESKAAWFGPEIKVKGVGSWNRSEDYRGETVYLEDIDLDLLKDCNQCMRVVDLMKTQYSMAKTTVFDKYCKSLKIVASRNDAKYIGSFKIVNVKEVRSWQKLPLGWGSGADDTYQAWFKLVETKTNKVIFGYCTIGTISESQQRFDSSFRRVVTAIDDYDKAKASGIWFTDCP